MKRKPLIKRGLLFVVSAPSGCGKTTICRQLASTSPKLNSSISVTTRPPRDNETNGRDYYFVSREKFLKMRRDGKLLEWARNFGYFYGTPRGFVDKALMEGKDMLLAIDVKGARKVKKIKPESVTIFLAPPSISSLRQRLKKRGTDSPREIKKRLKVAEREIAQSKKYDYVVVNDTIEKALGRLRSIVRYEKIKKRTRKKR